MILIINNHTTIWEDHMLRKNHTIGIRVDELTVSLPSDAATIFNISKSEVLRNALTATYGTSVYSYKNNNNETIPHHA